MYQLSANIELLFTEAGPDFADRVRAAAAAGFDAVEIWGTFEKDLDNLGAALRDTGVTLTSVLAEPRTNFTLPWETDRTPFLDGLARGVDNARLLGSPHIVVGSGIGFPGMKRVQNLQKLIDAYGMAVDRVKGSGVTMVLEPVNSRVDHPGTLIDRTSDAVKVAEAVSDESFKILYDLYHSVTEGEDPATELKKRWLADRLRPVRRRCRPRRAGQRRHRLAGRARTLDAAGYVGPIGLEYIPTGPTAESVRVHPIRGRSRLIAEPGTRPQRTAGTGAGLRTFHGRRSSRLGEAVAVIAPGLERLSAPATGMRSRCR